MADVRVQTSQPSHQDGPAHWDEGRGLRVHPDDLAAWAVAWLATDAGRAAIRAGVRAELRHLVTTARETGVPMEDLLDMEELTARPAPREPAQDGGSDAAERAHVRRQEFAEECHRRGLAQPGQDEPATPPLFVDGYFADRIARGEKPPGYGDRMARPVTQAGSDALGKALRASSQSVAQDEPAAGAAPLKVMPESMATQLESVASVLVARLMPAESAVCTVGAEMIRALTPPAALQPAQEPAAGVSCKSCGGLGYIRGPEESVCCNQCGGTGRAWPIKDLVVELRDRAKTMKRESATDLGRRRAWLMAKAADVIERLSATPPAAPDPLLPGLRAAREIINRLCAEHDGFMYLRVLAAVDAEIARRGGA